MVHTMFLLGCMAVTIYVIVQQEKEDRRNGY